MDVTVIWTCDEKYKGKRMVEMRKEKTRAMKRLRGIRLESVKENLRENELESNEYV